MSPGRFLRTTPWRSAADEMETLPAARCPPDHPSCTQFIVKMAPLPSCSDCPGPEDNDPSLPTTRVRWQLYRFQIEVMRITWADATCVPWSRPPGPPTPRPHCSTPTPTSPRSSTATWFSSTTPWTLSPRSREAQGWPRSVVLFLLCTERAATRSRNRFGSRRPRLETEDLSQEKTCQCRLSSPDEHQREPRIADLPRWYSL